MATTKLEDLSEQQAKEQTGQTTQAKVEKVKAQTEQFKPLIVFLVLAGLLHTIGIQWPEVLGAFLAINGKSLLNITVKQALPAKKN